METREERIERRRRERAEQVAYKLEQEIAVWDPNSAPNITVDPFKTLFVARIVSNALRACVVHTLVEIWTCVYVDSGRLILPFLIGRIMYLKFYDKVKGLQCCCFLPIFNENSPKIVT